MKKSSGATQLLERTDIKSPQCKSKKFSKNGKDITNTQLSQTFKSSKYSRHFIHNQVLSKPRLMNVRTDEG